MSEDTLTAVAIDRDSLLPFIELSTAPEQQLFVASNAVSIAQGCFADGTALRGLLWNGEPAGFYSVINPALTKDDPHSFQPGCAYLWRFMIDHRFQAKRLGSRALTLIFETAIAEGFSGLSLTAVDDVPGCPVPFYRKQGFALTGRILEGEVELVKRVGS